MRNEELFLLEIQNLRNSKPQKNFEPLNFEL